MRSGTAVFGMALLVSVCSISQSVRAQGMVRIYVLPGSAAIRIEGETIPGRAWSFRKSYGSVIDLGRRITKFTLSDEKEKGIAVREVAPGEYESAQPASRFRYEVRLAPPIEPGDAAMVSWMDSGNALLLMGDLLPEWQPQADSSQSAADKSQPGVPARAKSTSIQFHLPDGWDVYTSEQRDGNGEFTVNDPSRAVFIAGPRLRTRVGRIDTMNFSLITNSDWAFDDNEAFELAAKILREHKRIFSSMPSDRAALILLPFPMPVSADKWTAETRGSTVTLLLGRQPSKVGALAQLSVPLTHELFHFWVPNALTLKGDYDWFYEGFTTYEASKAAVRLHLLTFPEFLNGIARAYDKYRVSENVDRLSLIDASAQRWTGGQAVVYQKAMVVALIYDLNLRFQSRGKKSLDDVYRNLLSHYAFVRQNSEDSHSEVTPRGSYDGNIVTLAALNTPVGIQTVVQDFVQRPAVINLESALAAFGLKVETFGSRSRISVMPKLTRQQGDLLKELGYNEGH